MTPPRVARWMLERWLDRRSMEALTGDLLEEFRQRAAAGRRGAAHWWYWRQAIAAILWRRWPAWRRRDREPKVPADRKAGFLDGLRQDMFFSFRTLRRAPAFALTAILTLALGIGAATAIATAAHRALIRPLPYPHGDRLVFAGHPDDNNPTVIGNVGFTTVVDWRARTQTLDEMAIIRGWGPTLVDDRGAEVINGLKVNWNYFRMLGVHPALGRDFTPEDDHPDRWRVVMLSDRLWRRRFGARQDVVGSSVEFNGRRYAVAGVLPSSFEPLISEHFYKRAEIWAPLGYALGGDSSCRSCQHLRVLGRLRPDNTVDDARADLARVHSGLRREHPADYTDATPGVRLLRDELTGSLRVPLQVLLVAVAFVLIVACANVAGLLMARATDREREMVVRAALGARRLRLARQLATESLTLAVVAAVLGVLVAKWGLAMLTRYAPVTVPRLDEAAADPLILAIGAALGAAALLAFGFIPAWTSTRLDLQSVLREQRQSPGRSVVRIRELLLAAEVAVALVLVAGACLMFRTVDRLLGVNPGFDPRGVLSAGLSLVGPSWAEDSAVRTFQERLLEHVRALPGVEAAALAGQIPLGNNYDRWGFRIEGRTFANEAEAPSVERYAITPGYFDVMRIPVLRGRPFDDRDITGGELVLVVSDTTARTLWPNEDPIGQRVRIGGSDGPWRKVIGIVGDVRHYALGEVPTTQMYVPQRQMTDSYLVLVARTAGEPSAVAGPLRATIAGMARDVPVYDVATLEERMTSSVATRRFLLMLLGVFAAATLGLTAVGLYGVVSQAVSARRREFGIRLALGAERSDVLRLVLGRGLGLVGVGIAAGLTISSVLGRWIGSQLYDIAPSDPISLGGAAVMLLAVGCVAHVVPLRRAVAVDPALALRND